MRHVLILLVLLAAGIRAAEENPLKPLADKMAAVRDKLYEDRHDAFVRIELQDIEDKLTGMISQMEKSEQQQKQDQKQKQNPEQQQRQQRQQQREMAMAPKPNSQLGQATPPGPDSEAAKVAGEQSRWAKLPKAQRDELLQSYAAELPSRWKKRLEAYFYSIAIEEEKKR